MNALQQAFQKAKTAAGVVCPYCGNPAVLVRGQAIYPHRPDLFDKRFWQCAPCDAYVGCHQPNKRLGFDGTQPLGRLANKALRAAKHAAHTAFDPKWKGGSMSRRDAYVWLADRLGIAVEACHIGEFDIDQCQRTIAACDSTRAPVYYRLINPQDMVRSD